MGVSTLAGGLSNHGEEKLIPIQGISRLDKSHKEDNGSKKYSLLLKVLFDQVGVSN